jgi:hypothetical protein
MAKKILILAANPRDTVKVRVNQEFEEIKNIFKENNNFVVKENLAVTPDNLSDTLSEHQPDIVHFIGHGKGKDGMILEDDDGLKLLVNNEGFTDIFEYFSIECLYLNSCHSVVQAKKIVQHINYVIGMQDEIENKIAKKFATKFYRELARGKDYKSAFQFARSAVKLIDLQGANIPRIICNPNQFQDHIEKESSSKPTEQEEILNEGNIQNKILQDAFQIALVKLLSLQYPWGEWSDSRTVLESKIAERNPYRGIAGPKPNVARTLFALEALEYFKFSEIDERKKQAFIWISKNITEGWYLEWVSSQAFDSESDLPSLIKRKDIRHTAQATSVFCRWGHEREPLAYLLPNIIDSMLDNGLWSDTPGEKTPRLLSTIYSIEALGYAISGKFRIPITDLLNKTVVNELQFSFRRSIAAIHREADNGDGLLGYSFSKPTPYLTGLALFRLAPLGNLNEELSNLVLKLIQGITNSVEDNGWVDLSVGNEHKLATLKRTTLRIAAGIQLARKEGFAVSSDILALLNKLIPEFINEPQGSTLDSPDFACTIIYLLPIIKKDFDLKSIINVVKSNTFKFYKHWINDYEKYVSDLSTGVELGLPGYAELSSTLIEKLKYFDGYN